MEAEFFTIMPAATGWQLYHGNVGCGWYPRWDQAVSVADVMADARNHARCVATAVVVTLENREAAVVTVYA